MSSEPELPAGAAGPVTATVTRRVKPGHEDAYEQFLAGISGAAKAFPGYLGEEVFRPAGGEGGEYRIVYRFDSPAHLRDWLNSGERAAWLQDGRAHLGDDLPADHPGRRRVGAPARAPAAGSPARGHDAGDRVADD